MKRIALVALLGLGLAGCQQEEVDVFCRSYTLADVSFSRQAVRAMTPEDKRKYAQLLEGAGTLCGWKPPA